MGIGALCSVGMKLCSVGTEAISSALCCLYRHSFYQTDHSILWWNVVGRNWLMLCQECGWSVFLARYCFSCTLLIFFPLWKKKIIGYADESTLMAVVPFPGVRVTLAEHIIHDLGRVSELCDL